MLNLLISAGIFLSQATPTEVLRDRYAFAQKFVQVKEGMTANEVKGLLGPPELVEKPDPVNYSGPDSVYWLYGTSPDDDFPTLGKVTFDSKQRVLETPLTDLPSKDLPDEMITRGVLRKIGAADKDPGAGFNPREEIRAVNALVRLGPVQGPAILTEFFRCCGPGGDGVFAILRVVYEVPDPPGYIPRPMIGLSLHPPDVMSVEPRFPWSIIRGIPLCVGKPGPMAGAVEEPADHFATLTKLCKFRHDLLQPSNEPWLALDDLAKRSSVDVRPQILSLLSTVFRPNRISWKRREEDWKAMIEELTTLGVHWDTEKEEYVFFNGKTLPPSEQPLPSTYANFSAFVEEASFFSA
jgi:hypothetical protein